MSLAGPSSQPFDLSFIFRLIHRPLPVRPFTYVPFAHAAARQPMYNHSHRKRSPAGGRECNCKHIQGSARRSWDHGPSKVNYGPPVEPRAREITGTLAATGRRVVRNRSRATRGEGATPPTEIGARIKKGRIQLGNPVGGGALGRCTGGLPVGCRLSPGSPPPPGRYPIPTATLS